MASATYYDYKKDFPKGNGWVVSEFDIKFVGEIIDSPNYVFSVGKYKDKSLQYIIEYCWRGVIKYIDYGLIYITNDSISKLKCSTQKLTALKVAKDAKLRFCRIYDSNDELFASPYPCTYQGELLRDVIVKDPLYVYSLFYRALYPRYGTNQRYYAWDQVSSVFGEDKTSSLKRIINHLSVRKISGEYVDRLKSILIDLEDEKRNAEIVEYNRWMEEVEKDIIREGYREAFNDDPEAEWNID